MDITVSANVPSNPPRGSMANIVLTSMAVMSGAFTFGIESGTIAGFQAMESWLKDFGYYDEQLHEWNIHTSTQLQIGALMLVGAVLGSLLSGPIGTKLGRKPGLVAIALTAILGVIFQVVHASLTLLLIGRFLQGGAIGFASNFVPVYQSEIAPARYRGILVSLYQLGVNIGGLVGTCINQGTYNMRTRWAYRIPLLASLFFPTILFIVTFMLPESPRWLLSVDRTEDARNSLRRLRGKEYPEDQIEQDIRTIAEHIAIERQFELNSSCIDLFKGTDRRRTSIVSMVLLFQILSGITFVTSYGTYFFQASGVNNAFLITIVGALCQLAGLLVLYPSLRFMGRRTILLSGAVAEVVCWFVVAIVAVAAPNAPAAASCLVAFICLFTFFFTWSWGAVGWIVASEVSSNKLRSRTQSLGTTINWTTSLIVAAISPYLINTSAANLGGEIGFIWGSLTFVGLIWAYFYLPETDGRTLEEIDEIFMKNIPARKFSTYHLEDHANSYGRRTSKDTKFKEDVQITHEENRV
ncbi:hypothetical protein N7462_004385 [Penicillium macrosclerotiorum]|uniref:uncharacterized protein n=1 Tax=Penicillium macrosclerotiorum TaxID=303699 RepID=UPI0025494185|nr:uncharacterized protein N7462_004385 [Penicillium macrosclerotiorum]KAJ5689993.1 hypothetical protein N7462_004385 [Penicillium macrosclerotiorum]